MNNNDLIGLREIFRKKFREEDFYDEEQIEKVFRELLNEPEPIRELNIEWKSDTPVKLTFNKMAKIIQETYTTEKLKEIFEADDPFYKVIMRKK